YFPLLFFIDEEIVISTTRPETMLGDTAVMVHPDDDRYKHLHGKFLFHPFRKDTIPLIADDHVDPKFGTGAVKITPAHSAKDYEVGLKHKLEQITVFDDSGNVCIAEFEAQPRFLVRDSVLEALKQLGLYRGCKSHAMSVPRCSRTNDIIEPLLKPQWFLNVKEMAAKAVSAVQNGKLSIYPQGYKSVWYEWLEKNIQDWCISRQLWWGHRIPAYQVQTEDYSEDSWIAAKSEDEARKLFLKKTGTPESKIKQIKQEEDVLDTWFSSALLPFAAFGWPQNSEDFNHFYPTTLLETGHDILFFWVARMVMMGLELTDTLPFKTVLLHSLVHDAQGQKMSKSRGNVVDPMDVIDGASLQVLHDRIRDSQKLGILNKEQAEVALQHQKSLFPQGIPTCGADALRLSLCSCSLENQYVAVDVRRMEQNKFLGNKIWQVMRFLFMALEGLGNDRCCSIVDICQRDELQVMDKWILSQLAHLVESAERNFTSFNLHLVVGNFDHFWYKCLCDVYLECIKPQLNKDNKERKFLILQTLWSCMDVGLRVLSPFMPFLTEELYQRLPRVSEKYESIIQCQYPLTKEWQPWRDKPLEEQVGTLLDVAFAFRSLKGAYNVEGRKFKNIEGSVMTETPQTNTFLTETASVLQTLARLTSLSILDSSSDAPATAATNIVSNTITVYLHLEGLIDPEIELIRLQKKINKIVKREKELLKIMSSRRYAEKTPLHIKKSNENKLAVLRKECMQVESIMCTLEKLQGNL
ncbi:hypothetical protein SK128_026260, partial [Halocaridina rubra]